MYSNETRFFIARTDLGQHYRFLYGIKEDGQLKYAEPITFKLRDLNELIDPEPMMRLQEEEVTQLMDQLWIAGIRPSRAIVEPQNVDHMNSEISWLRETADHLMKKGK